MANHLDIQQFIQGMTAIQRAVVEIARDAGIALTAKHFKWHRGKDFLPPPSILELRVETSLGSADAVFNQEQVTACWRGVTRDDVRTIVSDLVVDLKMADRDQPNP